MFWTHWWFWLYAAAWAPYVCCLALYGLRSPWWTSWAGRSLMTLYAALTAVLTLTLLFQIWRPSYPLAVALSVAALGGVAVAGFVQLALIVRLQRRDRDEETR